MFGGVPWLTWYLCIGDIPATLVEIVNAYIEGNVVEEGGRQPTTGPHPAPLLSARGRAQRAGRLLPQRRGVHHQETEAKKARRAAKLLDKRVANEQDLWSNGRSHVRWRQWTKLLADREAPSRNNTSREL